MSLIHFELIFEYEVHLHSFAAPFIKETILFP